MLTQLSPLPLLMRLLIGGNLDNIQMLTQLSPLQLRYAVAYWGNPRPPQEQISC